MTRCRSLTALTAQPNEKPRVEVQHGRQVELAAAPDPKLRRVRDPALIGRIGDEVPGEHVRGDRLVMLAHRRPLEPFAHTGTQALELHQPHYAFATDRLALLPQVLMHARAAIPTPAPLMRGSDQHAQPLVSSSPRRRRPVPPRVEPARRDIEDPTHRSHAERGLLRLDERELYTCSLAKKAAAFFRISRSVRSVRTSLRNRRSSSRSSRVRPVRPWVRSARSRSTQFRSAESVRSSSRAT